MCLAESEANIRVSIKGREFKFGENRYYPNEEPIKVAQVADFNIDKIEVTNAQFRAFTDSTGYVTAAERDLSEVEFPNIPAEFTSHLVAVYFRR
jgi:sulfatase modifying factor 1